LACHEIAAAASCSFLKIEGFSQASRQKNLRRGPSGLKTKEAWGICVGNAHRIQQAGRHWDLDAVLTLFPALGSMLKRPAGQMSGGEQQMLTDCQGADGTTIAIAAR
jgi:hypothetical protein